MRISDWSSDVCASDLADRVEQLGDDRGLGRLRVLGHRVAHHDDRKRWRGVATSWVEQAGAADRSDVEVDDLHVLHPLWCPGDAVAALVDNDGRAVVDQLVLSATLVHLGDVAVRSEERHEGRECGSTGGYRWWIYI